LVRALGSPSKIIEEDGEGGGLLKAIIHSAKLTRRRKKERGPTIKEKKGPNGVEKLIAHPLEVWSNRGGRGELNLGET